MIDLHAHVLPGFDDGVRTLDEALELVRSAAAEGVTAIAATPHVRDDFPTTAERMEQGVATLRAELAAHGIAIAIVSGGEVAVSRAWQLAPSELRRFTYAGGGRWLLVETPYRDGLERLAQTQAMLAAQGIGVVLAHPERNAAVQRRPELVLPLVRAGAVLQLTAGSLAGALGRAASETALRLLALDTPALLASDAHGPFEPGRTGLAAGLADLADDELADRLVRRVPAAILAGEETVPDG